MADSSTFDKNFNLIKQRFIERVQNWLPIFEKFQGELTQNKIGDAEDIRMRAHKLAGSASMFSFRMLSGYARDLEQKLDEIIEGRIINESSLLPLKKTLDIFLSEARGIASSQDDLQNDNNDLAVKLIEKNNKKYGYRILVADDDELVRDLLEGGLQKEKCDIIHAEDGEKVLNILKKEDSKNLDLIVLDINMPKLNGFEVLKKLKSESKLQAIPVIMLTRHDEHESIIKSISSGAIDYITKPFETKKLINRILSILHHSKTKILIADGDELVRDTIKQRFYRMGYTVLVASDDNQVLDRMYIDQPDISILDIVTLDIDGLSILEKIKNDPEIAKMPIIILADKNHQENILKGLEIGALDYIMKPFDINELAKRVSDLLHRNKLN